jgi:hypothetical protein
MALSSAALSTPLGPPTGFVQLSIAKNRIDAMPASKTVFFIIKLLLKIDI